MTFQPNWRAFGKSAGFKSIDQMLDTPKPLGGVVISVSSGIALNLADKAEANPDYSPEVLEYRFLCAKMVSDLPRQAGSERLWRSLKYECVYLNAFETGSEARLGIGKWMTYYNAERPHSTHGILTPGEVYDNKTEPTSIAA